MKRRKSHRRIGSNPENKRNLNDIVRSRSQPQSPSTTGYKSHNHAVFPPPLELRTMATLSILSTCPSLAPFYKLIGHFISLIPCIMIGSVSFPREWQIMASTQPKCATPNWHMPLAAPSCTPLIPVGCVVLAGILHCINLVNGIPQLGLCRFEDSTFLP